MDLTTKKYSAFYPGAGHDIIPLVMYRYIKKWIYFDSQPMSEFGDNLYEGFERPNFIKQLIKIMEQNDFNLNHINDNIYIFYNSEHDQIVHYETNSIFPNYLQQRHYDCDTLILCGFDTEPYTIDIINKFSNIITNNITYRSLEEEQLLLKKSVSLILINIKWNYWEHKNLLTNNICKYVSIIDHFITHNELNNIEKDNSDFKCMI